MGKPIAWLLFIASFAVGEFVFFRIVPPLIRSNKGNLAYVWMMVSGLFLMAVTFGFFLAFGFIQELGNLVCSFIAVAMLVFLVYCAYMNSFLLRKHLPFPEQR